MEELVIGPWKGAFIATYACPVGEHGETFIGYYRVYRSRPRGFWEAGSLSSDSTPRGYSCPTAANSAAFRQAQAAMTAESCVPVLPNLNSRPSAFGALASRY